MRIRLPSSAGWVALALALVAAIAGVYVILDKLAGAEADAGTPRWLLPLLSASIVVLALGLAGVLIRNIVRLVMDRKRGILGSRLQTKLVFFFLALGLPPALFLFYGSAAVIRMSLEGMVRTPVEDLTRQSRQLVDEWTDVLMGHCGQQARDLARELGELTDTDAAALRGAIEQWRGGGALQVAVLGEGARVLASRTDTGIDPSAFTERTVALVRQASRTGGSGAGIDYLGDGILIHAVAPVMAGPGHGTHAAVGLYLPSNLASRLKRIEAVGEAYRQMRAQRRDLIRTYLSLLALILLASVFVATWMGFYLSRRITVPIEELASATREISLGNLDVRVRTHVGDEIGRLVESFNVMAAELQESREVISRSTADLRRSNRALDERRRYIETLLETLSTAVLSVDAAGAVTLANSACERVLGARPAVGADVGEILGRPGLEPLRDLLEGATVGEPRSVRRDLVLEAGGGPVSVSVQVTPLGGTHGDRGGTLVTVEDLSDLLRAQKAAAWREVARRIAHEIKNPLTPIQLAAQRIRKKFEEGAVDLPEVVPEATSSIEREVGALKRLVDEFSRFARLPEMRPEAVDVTDLIRSVHALYRGLPGIRWSIDTAPGLSSVQADAEQLRRVLINLVDNAVTAMEGHGTLSVRASTRPGFLVLDVGDSGPGIAAEDRDKMFAPYFSTKRRGTGLGLAIVHRIVTDHRGTIRVEDNLPHGARFVIEIPS